MSFQSTKLAFASIATLLPAAALAQAQPQPDAEKSPEQIQCELSENCVQTVTPAADAGADGSAADATGDGGVTRSWTWGRVASASPAQASPSRALVPAAGLARAARPTPVAATRRLRAAPQPTPGRTSLAIGFVPGSAAFTDQGRKQADKIYQALTASDFSQKHYLVSGHTDLAGDPDLNLDLSRRRAQALVDYLVGKGMAPTSFRVRGYGSTAWARSPNGPGGSNRRVEIVKLD